MKKVMGVGAILAAAILSAAPVSLNWSADKGLSVSQDKANAIVGRPAYAAKRCRRGPQDRSPGDTPQRLLIARLQRQ